MPTKFNSPYATAFKSAIKRGTSYNVAVNNIANRRNKNVTVIWNSLFKAGLVSREYDQTAVVSASFGNALPVAGALVAGPQVAAALEERFAD